LTIVNRGICEYTGIEGWIRSEVGTDKVGSGVVVVVQERHLLFVL
jgi:hypothetical protein